MKTIHKISLSLLQCLLISKECRLVVFELLPLWVFVGTVMCWEGEAVSPLQTDGYQQGSREWVLLYSGAKRLSCNLHCLSLIFALARCSFYLACVRACSFTPCAMLCVNISLCYKGAEGACWLVCVCVLEADTEGSKWHAGCSSA